MVDFVEIQVALDDGAYMPEKAHDADAGYDLKVPDTYKGVWVPARGYAAVDTGVHMIIPRGYVGKIESKSGLNFKHHLNTVGTVDAEYTGSIGVKIYNHSDIDYEFNPGDKITQIVIEKLPETKLKKIDVKDIKITERGASGYGQSGR